LLHLDDGLRHQRAFLEACRAEGAGETDLSAEAGAIRLWGKERDVEKLARALPAVSGARLTVMGSGDFHHVTALLLQQLGQSHSQPFTIVQFDNHPDWVHFNGGLHCGSWVNRALSYPNVRKAVTIGVTSDDLKWPELRGGNLRLLTEGRLELFPYAHAPSRVLRNYGEGESSTQIGRALHWRCASAMDDVEMIQRTLNSIPTDDVYITVDKDVLIEEDAAANWEQGQMPLARLTGLIRKLGAARHRR
jgi:arginase family enzyme